MLQVSMDASIDQGLLLKMFVELFGILWKSFFGAVLSALLNKEDLSWQQVSTWMLQEYDSPAFSKPADDSGREKTLW